MMIGHTKGKCWKLHGHPNWGPGGRNRSYAHQFDFSDKNPSSDDSNANSLCREIVNIRRVMNQTELSTKILPLLSFILEYHQIHHVR